MRCLPKKKQDSHAARYLCAYDLPYPLIGHARFCEGLLRLEPFIAKMYKRKEVKSRDKVYSTIDMATHKLYSEGEIKAMDDAADNSILAMTIVGVGIGFAPVMLDITVFMAEAGIGVVKIGKCYNMKLNKADAGDLIEHFFKAAGLAYSMVFTCEKFGSSALKSDPVSYIPTMTADAVMCGSISFAIGSTSKRYFKKLAEGKKDY